MTTTTTATTKERLESRLAALEEKLDKVDHKAWQGIWAQGEEVDELQERVERHDEDLYPARQRTYSPVDQNLC